MARPRKSKITEHDITEEQRARLADKFMFHGPGMAEPVTGASFAEIMQKMDKLPATEDPRPVLTAAYIEETVTTVREIECREAWIDVLAEALKPFAEHGRALRRTDPRGGARKELYEGGRNSVLRLGDFDRAVSALEKLNGH